MPLILFTQLNMPDISKISFLKVAKITSIENFQLQVPLIGELCEHIEDDALNCFVLFLKTCS